MPNDSKNTLVFVILMMALLVGYQTFIVAPAAKKRQLEAQAAAAAAAPAKAGATPGSVPSAAPGAATLTRDQALNASPNRVAIDTPSLAGSMSLTGGRIDDLFLKHYKQTIEPKSPQVELFRPAGAPFAYFADFGWTGANLLGLPDARTPWTARSQGALAPGRPVVMTYRTPQNLQFTRVVSVDDKYMFTVTDTVANYGQLPVTVAPYATVQRQGLPAGLGKEGVVHEGAIGIADGKLKLYKYAGWKKKNANAELPSTGGWFGITDKYWMAAVIPDQSQAVRASFRVTPSPRADIYDASYLGGYKSIAPGKQVTVSSRLFAGAKTVPVLKGYEDGGVAKFDQAVDWGMFWFFTRPIFSALHVFFQWLGNFGLAIMLLTVCAKLLFFWPSNKSYESLTKMKKVQPQLEEIKKKHKADPAKQQQAMMQLYQQEKINPFMGCLPILIQIPVFYALYKVLSVTIEMRHAPFFGWVRDLSAPEPMSIFTLFGLIPWDPSVIPLIGAPLAHMGPWPILMGISMWLSQSMSPTTGMDPTQAKIMKLFPLVFTFILAPYAVGLVIYWTWNNLLSIAQQYVIMRRYQVDNPIDDILRRVKGLGGAAKG